MIQIGENITITVVNIKANQVKVAIDAPQSVRILRGELCEFWANQDDKAKSDRPRIRHSKQPAPVIVPGHRDGNAVSS
jgi:carbon storage regulator CsrA